MSADVNQFKQWMDARRLKAPDVARRFGVSEQTIAHWRSKGVPLRKREHAQDVMDSWDAKPAEQGMVSNSQPLTVYPTRDQFRTWNQAALDAGMLLEEWATEGLTRLAEGWLEAQAGKAVPLERKLTEPKRETA